MVTPPSSSSVWPVTYEAAGLAYQRTASATSSMLQKRLSGIWLSAASMYFGSVAFFARAGDFVSTRPGAIELTRTPWSAHSIASIRVMWSIAAFDTPQATRPGRQGPNPGGDVMLMISLGGRAAI